MFLFLNTSYTSDIGLRRFKLELTWEPLPQELNFLVLKDAMVVAKGGKKPIVLSSCEPMNHNNDLPGKIPQRQQWYPYLHSCLIGHQVCPRGRK